MKKSFNKKLLLPLVLIVIILCAALLMPKNTSAKETVLSLDALKKDDQYQLENLSWGMTVKEVSKQLPYALKENTDRAISSGNITFYQSSNVYTLDEMKSYASFEFHDDRLALIQFSFELEEDSEAWFETQAEALTRLYGAASDTFENSSDTMRSIGYRWDTENTSLQLVLLSGNSIHTTAVLSIGQK